MKYSFFLLIILSLSCTNNSVNNTDNINDTSVRVFDIPPDLSGENYTEKLYFLIINNDTSDYKFTLTENNVSGKVSLNYTYQPYLILVDSDVLNDSSVLSDRIPLDKVLNHDKTYKSQLREFKIILDYATKHFDLSKMSSIRLMLSSIDSLNNIIMEEYGNMVKIKTDTNEALQKKILKSTVVKDLNGILAAHGLKIKKVDLDGVVYSDLGRQKNSELIVPELYIQALVILSLSTN